MDVAGDLGETNLVFLCREWLLPADVGDEESEADPRLRYRRARTVRRAW